MSSSSSPFSPLLTRSFGVLLALLLFLVGFAMWNFRSLSAANHLNIHTYQVINSTLELESTLFAIDSGVRSFLATGEPGALNSYGSNVRTYRQRSRALRLSTRDNPVQTGNIDKLDARVARWLKDLMEPTIARRQKLVDASQQLALASRSSAARRRAIKELGELTSAIANVEQQLLIQRTAGQQHAQWWTQFTLLTGGAFSVLLTGFLVSFASKSARQLDRSNALLLEAKSRTEAANADLLHTNAQLETEIEARRVADEKLRRSVLNLQRSNAELEQFAYVASHDLQEPLRAVGGCVQVLQRRYQGQLDARADQFIQHAVDGASRMQNLINDLLSYSRVGTKIKSFAPVPGNQIIAAALQSVSVATRESGAQIRVDEMPTLVCDAGQIEQVLQNLVSNAIKFRGAAPPQIHIGYATQTQGEARFHVLSVEDAGLGIEPQYFERIFVMFQRLHTRTEYAGTGIGLAICKKIVERHGGKIRVESWTKNAGETADSNEQKHGSKFTFSLPFEPDRAETAEAEAQALQDAEIPLVTPVVSAAVTLVSA